MLKHSLVYIRSAGDGDTFVGCGAYIEENLVATCRHVWRDVREPAEAVFPHVRRNGQPFATALTLVDECKGADGDDPDLVLLRPAEAPKDIAPAQVARDAAYECGEARALARLPSREIDDPIAGTVDTYVNASGRRKFSAPNATDHWLEEGSSGSPVFLASGQQLAGLVSMAELGAKPQNAPIRVAYVVPGTIIWPYVRAVARRQFDKEQQAIRRALQADDEAGSARGLIFAIARRSGAAPAATFNQTPQHVSAAN